MGSTAQAVNSVTPERGRASRAAQVSVLSGMRHARARAGVEQEGGRSPSVDSRLTLKGTAGTVGQTFKLDSGMKGSARSTWWAPASMDLPALRAAMEGNGVAWSSLLAQDLDPDSVIVRHRDDGSESHDLMGIRLAQALHHGTDHRSQVCTTLTTLGVEPPAIDVWDFAEQAGRLVEVRPSA